MTVRFRVLGTVRGIGPDGAERPVPNGTPAELLARLLLRPGEWVPADALLAAHWPDATRAAAQHSLHVAVSTVRRALGPARELVENRRGAYRAAVAPAEVDVYAFRLAVAAAGKELDDGRVEQAAARVREATALLDGDPFAAVAGEPFDAERAAHRRAVAEARSIAFEHLIGAGRWDEAVAQALAALSSEPSAPAWEALLRAEYLRDGPEAALRRSDEAVAAGGDSWRLQRLRQAVLSGDRAFVLSPRRAGPPSAAARAPEPVQAPELVAAAASGVPEALASLDRRYRGVLAALDDAWQARRYEAACELVAGLHGYWRLRSACADGTRWLLAALGRPELRPAEREACRETLALLLQRQGRADAARHYGAAPENAGAEPETALVEARRAVARAAAGEGEPLLGARGKLARALRAAGRSGEAVIEAAGLAGAAAAADDRAVLADALEVLAAADPDPGRAGRAAGAAAALAWRSGARAPDAPRHDDDGWREGWSQAWERVLALPDRGPSPGAQEVLAAAWERP
jgi:DNA-binding SARP family transcriptional activator